MSFASPKNSSDVPDIENMLSKIAQESPTQIWNKYKMIFNTSE
jgi:hypothetical protein